MLVLLLCHDVTVTTGANFPPTDKAAATLNSYHELRQRPAQGGAHLEGLVTFRTCAAQGQKPAHKRTSKRGGQEVSVHRNCQSHAHREPSAYAPNYDSYDTVPTVHIAPHPERRIIISRQQHTPCVHAYKSNRSTPILHKRACHRQEMRQIWVDVSHGRGAGSPRLPTKAKSTTRSRANMTKPPVQPPPGLLLFFFVECLCLLSRQVRATPRGLS